MLYNLTLFATRFLSIDTVGKVRFVDNIFMMWQNHWRINFWQLHGSKQQMHKLRILNSGLMQYIKKWLERSNATKLLRRLYNGWNLVAPLIYYCLGEMQRLRLSYIISHNCRKLQNHLRKKSQPSLYPWSTTLFSIHVIPSIHHISSLSLMLDRVAA